MGKDDTKTYIVCYEYDDGYSEKRALIKRAYGKNRQRALDNWWRGVVESENALHECMTPLWVARLHDPSYTQGATRVTAIRKRVETSPWIVEE